MASLSVSADNVKCDQRFSVYDFVCVFRIDSIRTRFLSTEANLLLGLYISVSSRDLRSRIDRGFNELRV
jgi:hypothetical protein